MNRRLFLGAEMLLYLTFLVFDLTGLGDTRLLKYTSILLCFLWVRGRTERKDGQIVALALTFTLVADLFLLVLNRWYFLGLCAFCVVQALYAFRILRLRRFRKNGVLPSLLARGALVLAAWGFLLGLHILEPLTAIAALYFSQLLANACQSHSLQNPCFTLGLVLFLGCDLCVGLHNLADFLPVADGPLFAFAQIGMWLFYLPSQVLIALSVRKESV